MRGKELGSARTRPEIPAVAAEFLRRQRMLLVGAESRDGRLWATVLTGEEGFAQAVDERTLVVSAVPGEHDPLAELDEGEIGMLAIEPATRHRMRVNGTVRREGGRLVVRTEQTYANCPKYIQTRDLSGERGGPPGEVSTTRALTREQRAWIGSADTFFVATRAPGLGADLSHRGGNPGFVRVVDERRLVWPDYVGNFMYMTLGNLELDDACALLFLDWESGDALHLSGRGRVEWDAGDVPGAQRLVEFEVDRVVHARRASPLRWRFDGYSPFNPPVVEPDRVTEAEPGQSAEPAVRERAAEPRGITEPGHVTGSVRIT